MVAYITGLGGTGAGYFADQDGQPRLLLGDEAWGLLANAGAWNSGDWQGTISAYLAARAGQGFTTMITSALSFGGDGACVHTDGNDWDNLAPWVSAGDPSSGLNETFWARRDYLITTAASYGITVIMNPCFNLAFQGAGTALNGKTATQFGDYGTNLGNRYKNFPNLMWIVGDDYFGTIDTELTAFRTGLRGAGDTHALTIQNYQETTSRTDLFDGSHPPWGTSFAEFSWVYSYNVSYDGVEKAHLEASPLPLARGDGQFIVPGGAADALLQRSLAWWALSSGARGYNAGSENVWRWEAGAAAAVTSDVFFADGTAAHIRSVFESLQGWHLLIPDTSSLLVTAGRGTHRSPIVSGGGGTAYTGNSDAYVTASRTASGSLAVIYLSHATTITIDQTKMAAGYGAKWYDPASGAVQSATPGATYNSAPLGNNSAGDPDWVLVLAVPPYATWAVP